jgi:hypothetical protein
VIGGSRGFEPFSRLWREQCTFGAFGQNGHIFPNGENLMMRSVINEPGLMSTLLLSSHRSAKRVKMVVFGGLGAKWAVCYMP